MSELKDARRQTREQTTRRAQPGAAEHEAHSGASRQSRVSVLLSSRLAGLARFSLATLLFFAAYLSTLDRLPWPFGPGTASAADNVIVSYVGVNSVHLLLDYTGGCDAPLNTCEWRLMVDSEPVPLLTSTTGWASYPFLHSVSNGTHEYRFDVINKLVSPPNSEHTHSTLPVSVTVNGHTAGGALLFDETLSADTVPSGSVTCNGGITVPGGTSLTLSGVTVVSGSPLCEIKVAGTLNLAPDANTAAIGIVLNSPQQFYTISNANLTFAAGSGGSNVFDSHDASLFFTAGSGGSSVYSSHDFSLATTGVDGWIEVSDSITVSLGYLFLSGGGELRLKGVNSASSFLAAGPGKLTIDDCTLDGPLPFLNMDLDGDLQISNSRFRGSVDLYGGASSTRSIVIEGSHFAKSVQLNGRTSAQITDNVFAGALLFAEDWCAATSPEPAIRDNSFVGRTAIDIPWQQPVCDSKIAIGANYYGDQAGYGGNDAPYRNAFLRRGSLVNTGFFSPAAAKKIGPAGIDKGVFPQFWLNGYRFGQGTLGSGQQLVQGKETLLSLDLVSSDPTVDGVKVWAVLDGQTVDPTEGKSVVLHRDTRDYGANANFYANSTVDIILPAVNMNSATLEVWLDTTGVTGYDADVTGGKKVQLGELSGPLTFKAPPARKLRIAVVPIQLGVTGTLASVGDLPASLPAMMAAMFPVTTGSIEVRVRPPLVDKRSHWGVVGMLNYLSGQLTLWRAMSNSYAQNQNRPAEAIDFYIAVMPAGSMGRAEGANMRLRRNVIFVDEKKLEAVIHEMGHALALYTGYGEQYEWPNYPTHGQPLVNLTAFSGLQPTGNAKIDSQFTTGPDGRIRHLVSENNAEYNPNDIWVDVMGDGQKWEWPLPSTAAAFASLFSSLQPLVSAQAAPAAVSPGYRRIGVSMRTERVEAIDYYDDPYDPFFSHYGQPCIDFQPISGTVRVLDMGTGGSGASTASTSGSALAPTQGALPLCGNYSDGWGFLTILAYDATGQPIGRKEMGTLMPEVHPGLESDYFWITRDVPTQTTRLKIVFYHPPNEVLLDLNLAAGAISQLGAPAVQILQPTAGVTLTNPVVLSWTTSGASATGQPLQYTVFYSASGATAWQLAGPSFDAGLASTEVITFPTDFLPASNRIAFKVVASDGFRSFEAIVDNLKLLNRAPAVVILSPLNGDQAVPGTTWALQAAAIDVEDGLVTQGVWYDSVQGQLGIGTTVSNVILIAGSHVLTYTATDSGTQTGSAQVTVTVGAMATVDLGLGADALVVSIPQRDPSDSSEARLKVGLPHQASLTVRNAGTNVTATLSLSVTLPGGAESLLAAKQVRMGAFEPGLVTASFTPTIAGSYLLRGAISGATPSDGNPLNDSRTVTMTAAMPPALSASAASFDFGDVTVNRTVTRSLTLSNNGGMELVIRPLSVTGTDWQSFGLRQDLCSYTILAPGSTCTVAVAGAPKSPGAKGAWLEISSTDPAHPVLTGTLTLNGIPPKLVFLPLVRK